MDAIRRIKIFNAGRDPERLDIKYRKMRNNAFAFLRGTCHLFYARLPQEGILKNAPLAWVCGDLHLENFGSYKGDNRLVYFDINDFDEAALAPATWDLARMLTSVRVGADSMGISPSRAQTLCTVFLDTYTSTLAAGKSYWVERETAQGPVRALLDGLRDRQRVQFLDTRTDVKGKNRILRMDVKKALPASSMQRTAVTDFMASFAKSQANPGFYKVLDVARRVAGTGSLGLERYVILVQGKGSPNGNYLLDLKLSLPSSLIPQLRVSQPLWATEAHRVVMLQRRLQAVSMAFLQPVLMGETAYILRGLQPSEDRIALDHTSLSMPDLTEVIGTMGRVVAWAHLRGAGREGSANADALIDFGQRKKWKEKLLASSEVCAAQARTDSATFNAAFDAGAFSAK